MTGQGTIGPPLAAPHEHQAQDDWVHRFGPTERFAHWWTVGTLTAAGLTGLMMGDDAEGTMPWVHVGTVVACGAGLLAALVLGNTRALLRAARALFVLDRTDADWLRAHRPGGPVAERHGEWGMFNAGQKILAWALTLTVTVIITTGVVALVSDGTAGGLHAAAVVVALVLLGGHVLMAALNPATNHALHGMLSGRVRRAWALRHHGGWVHEQEERDRSIRR
jgi:formate dehydrogenase subunit gamma